MEGEFDKIASIGMFEHVGIANHPTYFRTVHRLLRPRGLYLHHTIARRAKGYDQAFGRLKAEDKADHALHLPRRRTRSSRHVGGQPGALRLRGARRRGWREHYQRTTRLWWRTSANRAPRRPRSGPRRRGSGCSIWRAFRSASSAACRHLPDPGLEAHPGPVRPAAEPGGSVSVAHGSNRHRVTTTGVPTLTWS